MLATEKQKELATQLQIRNDRLTNLAYIISHNVRSHVANISGLIDVFELTANKDRDWAWGMLINTVNSLDETIHHLSTIMSIQDNPDLPMESVNVTDEINKVLQIIQLSTISAEATIRCDIDSKKHLTTNPAYFQSVLLNLLTNAVKYRSPDRKLDISISMSKEDDFTILKVSDNGLGIDLNKHQTQLFGMYKTFHGNKDAKGLGLFLSKRHIEALKGKMKVESKVGVGSTFKVFFPNV
ncbi:MAG: sensor histidine kinase [Arcticibacter sp.]